MIRIPNYQLLIKKFKKSGQKDNYNTLQLLKKVKTINSNYIKIKVWIMAKFIQCQTLIALVKIITIVNLC